MGPVETGDTVVIIRGPYEGQRGWVMGWRGDRPIVALEDDDVEFDPADVRKTVRTTGRKRS